MFNFKKVMDNKGALVWFERQRDIPFDIKRIYYIFDVKAGDRRGFHSHKQLEQCLICIAGSVKVLLDDGKERQEVLLNDNTKGLYVGRNIWREMFDFSENAVLLVLASEYFSEDDYVKDYNQFLKGCADENTST
jgi:dTDP-4-dehydrorhamnose 3,5-epimerase-like enzyme